MISLPLVYISIATAIVCSLLLLLQVRTRDAILLAAVLLITTAVCAIDSYILLYPEQLYLKNYALKVEAFLPLFALSFSAFYCRPARFSALSRSSRVLLPCTLLTLAYGLNQEVTSIYFAPDFGEEYILFLTDKGFAFYLVLMGLLVLAMVQIERTFSALSQFERWHVKYEIIGTCVLLGVSVVYYSQSLLYRSLDMEMTSARLFALLVASGLILYARLFRKQTERITISRSAAYRSLILFVVGAYLIGLGLLGEGMKYLNVSSQRNLLLVIAIICAVGVSVVLMSETLRRKIKVQLHKNFYQNKYDYREHWSAFTSRIIGAHSLADLEQSILETFCETFAFQGGSIYLLDPESGDYLNTAHFEFRRDWRQFSNDDPLVKKIAEKDWILDLKNLDGSLEQSLVQSFVADGATLVVPLFFDNELTGFIFLAGQIDGSEVYTYEDYDLMRMLARQSMAALQGMRLADQLSNARELAAIGKVSTFVLHDLKNQVSGLSLMLDNAREYIADPEFQQDMVETVDNTVSNMKSLIDRLKNLKEKPELLISPVELDRVVADAVESAKSRIEVTGEAVRIAADEEEIYKVILNLLLNAVEASAAGALVSLNYGHDAEMAFVKVSDTGSGMSEAFMREKLFKPFATTKKHGFGIGLYQCKQIVESHGGSIEVESVAGEGTTFTLWLPLAAEIADN